jgi:drug/metabolite transporter (DMT)-like permease
MPSLFVVIAIFIWSSLGVFVRYAGLPVYEIIFYSAFFSLLFQGPVIFGTPLRRHFPGMRQIPGILIVTILLLLNTTTFLLAYEKTTIANAVFTHYIAPVVVAVLAYLLLREKITKRIVLSILIASAGLWIMLGGVTIVDCFRSLMRDGLRLSGEMLGIVSGLSSGVFYALLIITIRFFVRKINPYVMVFLQNSLMVIILFPFVEISLKGNLWLLFLMGALHSTLAPFLYYRGLEEVQANRTAVLGYLEPVGAIIFSMIFLGEYPGLRSYLGGALILLAGYLTLKEKVDEKGS